MSLDVGEHSQQVRAGQYECIAEREYHGVSNGGCDAVSHVEMWRAVEGRLENKTS